jgi:phosphohistidine swiveling domain-containing protein
MLADGPLIARAALHGEDTAQTSGAGLGWSVPDLRSNAAVQGAMRSILEHSRDPWVIGHLGPRPRGRCDHVIVQRQVERRALVVAALFPRGHDYVEVHAHHAEALAAGTTPDYAGSVARWPAPEAPAVARVLERLRQASTVGPFGIDAELVIDPRGAVHLVQARPIVCDLTPGWPAFEAEVRRQGRAERLQGVLVLDAEHNPAPLSPAHAWLMEWLAANRPSAGRPSVLAGWLYVQALVRDLGSDRPGVPAREALERLCHELVPTARRRLDQIDVALARADATATATLLDQALEAFVAMIDAYLGVLVPARAAASPSGLRLPPAGPVDEPLSIRGRAGFTDVLPATWDVQSPTLADLQAERAPASPRAQESIPEDPAAAAILLTEWDDHLFALGLAPLRRVYLRASELLGRDDDVFMLHGPELTAALRGELDPDPIVRRRLADQTRFAALEPPLRIEDGRPVPVLPAGRLRGLAVGTDFEGPIAQRRDLTHLLASPPGPDAIVVLPALTAQAALALQSTGVRAVCCEHGGAMSHATLMARELGLSALIGCRACTTVPDGAFARIDVRLGRLWVADKSPAGPTGRRGRA